MGLGRLFKRAHWYLAGEDRLSVGGDLPLAVVLVLAIIAAIERFDGWWILCVLFGAVVAGRVLVVAVGVRYIRARVSADHEARLDGRQDGTAMTEH
jgi:hypothetical protein